MLTAGASPTARRWSPAGTRSSSAASPIRVRFRTPRSTRASPASTPRISAIGYQAFLEKTKPVWEGR